VTRDEAAQLLWVLSSFDTFDSLYVGYALDVDATAGFPHPDRRARPAALTSAATRSRGTVHDHQQSRRPDPFGGSSSITPSWNHTARAPIATAWSAMSAGQRRVDEDVRPRRRVRDVGQRG
jgi:hypothetical protein